MTIDEIKQLPKKELHCHLNGSIPFGIVKEIMEKEEIKIPNDFKYPTDLFINKRVKSMQEYFKPWALLKRLSMNKSAIDLIFEGVLANFRKENIDYAEIRISPKTIMDNNLLPFEEALEWLIDAIKKAEKNTGGQGRIILTLDRFNYSILFSERLFEALKSKNEDRYIVAVDVVGDEQYLLPTGSNTFFKKCKDELGLGITIHAGETGNTNNVREAIEDFNTDRIGHGIALVNDQKLVDVVIKKGICVEICLQSNYLATNVHCIDEHPVLKFIEYNIPFVICSDNPAIHSFSLSQEYELFYRITKRDDILKNMYVTQSAFCFK